MSNESEHDVAFSFLHGDEHLALDIADRIRNRVKIFIYSEHQKELIANDGVDAFSQVFKHRSRVVVVLFREAWGTTKWTRVEETAIKSRHLEEGPKFLVVASLDGKHPVWYPDTWIWGDLERYGIDGLASVIETKVRQSGGEVRSESMADYAAELDRQITFTNDLYSWRNSAKGVQDALKEVETLFCLLEKTCEQVSLSGHVHTQLHFADRTYDHVTPVPPSNRISVISGGNTELTVNWEHAYGDTLQMSGLRIVMSERVRVLVDPTQLALGDYNLDRDPSRGIGWHEISGGKTFYTSPELSDLWIRRLLDHLRDRALDNSN